MAEKVAEITDLPNGDIRITLSDPDGDMDTLRVTLPPDSAYKLGKALCMKALLVFSERVVTEATEALGDDKES